MSVIYHESLSRKVLGLAFTVHNIMGPGLVESAYEGAYCVELSQAGIAFERQKVYPLVYKGEYVSSYIADLVVENSVLVELKAVSQLTDVMSARTINYLKLSKIQVGYIINFANTSVEWKRFVCGKAAG